MKEHVEIAENKQETSVLEQYLAQTAQDENIHFAHADWIYSDSSDCCC